MVQKVGSCSIGYKVISRPFHSLITYTSEYKNGGLYGLKKVKYGLYWYEAIYD